MENNTVAVIIPIYKEQPDRNELVSLNQCLKVLNTRTIIFIAPQGLYTTVYQDVCSQHQLLFELIRFDRHYFANIAGYNQLMLSADFYKTFITYK